MNKSQVVEWITKHCTSLRRSQQKTLSEVTWGLMGARRAGVASIGRAMDGPAMVKHRIKRVDRFLGNEGVDPTAVMRTLVGMLVRRRGHTVVSLDWTEETARYKVLAAAIPCKGRALVVMWGLWEKWKLRRSQNNLEEGMLRHLRALAPWGSRMVLVADRGFGRTSLARTLQQIDMDYVIRVKGDAWIRTRRFAGRLCDYPLSPGSAKMLRGVAYRKHRAVRQNLAIVWKPGEREPWFLMTNLDTTARRAQALYEKRMPIEETFRDAKGIRSGFQLRSVRLTSKERYDRLLMAFALAYFFLYLIGLHLSATHDYRHWQSNTRKDELSLITLARTFWHPSHRSSLLLLLAHFFKHLNQYHGRKWG